MFRSCFAAALRNLQRNPLHSGVVILGLALGLAPAILIGLYLRDELSYERWIPDHQDIYRTVLHLELANLQTPPSAGTAAPVAGWLRSAFPQILAIGRMHADMRSLRRGLITGQERIYWSDPEIFAVLRLPTLAGDPRTALSAPDGLVLTRRMGRKYFGDEAPLGRMLDIDGKPFRIGAVLEDLPPQTHLDTEILASGRAALSSLPDVSLPLNLRSGFDVLASIYTYLRLKPGADIHSIERGLPALLEQHVQIPRGPDGKPWAPAPRVEMQPLAMIHFVPAGFNAMKPSGSLPLDYALAVIGALLVLICGCNFVSLMTVSNARRAVEVGIRKVAGAGRADLLWQVVGEAVLTVMLSTVMALALVELLAPHLSGFLMRPLAVDWLRQPGLLGAVLAVAVLLGVLASLYPAGVLAGLRPATTLRGGMTQPEGRAAVRTALVTVQLAILVGLIVVTGTVYRQARYATSESLRFDTDQVLGIRTDCRNALPAAVRALAGVRAAACTNDLFGVRGGTQVVMTLPDGSLPMVATMVNVEPGLLELFGWRPVAGRFFSVTHPGDQAQAAPTPAFDFFGSGGTVVINETAARRLGFASAEAAVGHPALVRGWQSTPMIIGVAPDARLEGARHRVQPVFFRSLPAYDHLMVKLRGENVPETLAAIDALWGRLGTGHPIDRTFLRSDIETLYLDVERQAELLAAVAAVAVTIAAFGMLGLAAFMAGRRTREMGIRKALGACATDIIRLLLWELTRPVLWGSLIAWPAAAYAMSRWLHTFVYHVDLEPEVFLGAAGAALLIAWVTVAGHALQLARLKPAAVLRHE